MEEQPDKAELKRLALNKRANRFYHNHAREICEKQKIKYRENIEANREKAMIYHRNKVGVVRPPGRPPKYTNNNSVQQNASYDNKKDEEQIAAET